MTDPPKLEGRPFTVLSSARKVVLSELALRSMQIKLCEANQFGAEVAEYAFRKYHFRKKER